MNGHMGAVRVLVRVGCNIDQQRKVSLFVKFSAQNPQT